MQPHGLQNFIDDVGLVVGGSADRRAGPRPEVLPAPHPRRQQPYRVAKATATSP